jgi:hypothetical protein
MRRFHWFQLVANGIFFLFMAIMSYVTYFAYSRIPGSTGQDMAEIQKTRYKVSAFNQIKEKEKKSVAGVDSRL